MPRLYVFLFCAALPIFGWFGLSLVNSLLTYRDLSLTTRAKITQWEIEPLNSEYALRATYDYSVKGQKYSASFRLLGPYFLNEAAALEALQLKAKDSWSAWYVPQNPQQSALQKEFPSNLIYRTLISFLVSLYAFLSLIRIKTH